MQSFRQKDKIIYTGTKHSDLTPGEQYTVRDMVGALHGGKEGPLTTRVRLVGRDVVKTYHPDEFQLV